MWVLNTFHSLMLVSLGCLRIGQRHRYSNWHHGVSKCLAVLILPSVQRPPSRRSTLKPQRRVVCSLLSSYAEPASRSMPGCSWNPSFSIIESWFGSNSELCPRCWLQLQREHIFDGCLPKQERSSKVESMCQSYQSCIVPAWHGTGAQVGSSTRSAAEASSSVWVVPPILKHCPRILKDAKHQEVFLPPESLLHVLKALIAIYLTCHVFCRLRLAVYGLTPKDSVLCPAFSLELLQLQRP